MNKYRISDLLLHYLPGRRIQKILHRDFMDSYKEGYLRRMLKNCLTPHHDESTRMVADTVIK